MGDSTLQKHPKKNNLQFVNQYEIIKLINYIIGGTYEKNTYIYNNTNIGFRFIKF